MKNVSKIVYYAAALCITAIGLIVAWPTMNQMPSYIHAWAQDDWYSIALGFQNNGFDFFHPETLIYNKQFPGWWMLDNGSTITSVDFPIHVYIVALFMKLFGTTAPWVFRCWTLIISLVGLYFLYLLGMRLTKSVVKSALIVLIVITSPVYAYYFNSYIPSAPSLALVFTGFWAYVRYVQENDRRFWHLAIATLGLAALIRTSQAVPFVAICCFELLRLTKDEDHKVTAKEYFSKFKKLLPSVIIVIVVILGYMAWNAHLKKTYGSLFLDHLEYPNGWEDVTDIFDNIRSRWKFHYFTELQHYVILLTMVVSVVFTVIFKKKVRRNSWLWLALIYSFGAMCFFVAMMRQYRDHDYYCLDSFFFPVVFIFIIGLRQLPNPKKWWTIGCSAAVLFLCIMMSIEVKDNIKNRRIGEDRTIVCAERYEKFGKWLDEKGIDRDVKILTIHAYSQNTPFIAMNRKGYTLMWCDQNIVDSTLNFKYDYISIEDQIFNNEFEFMYDVYSRFERIDGSDEVSLCKLHDTVFCKTADEFFKNK